MSRANCAPCVVRWPAALVAGLLLTLGPRASRAEADGPDYYAVRGVAADDVLNIRAEPDPHGRKVGEIPPNGTCIRNLGCRGGLTFHEFSTLTPAEQERRAREHPRWCKVEYQGVTGWVAGHYLAERGLPALMRMPAERDRVCNPVPNVSGPRATLCLPRRHQKNVSDGTNAPCGWQMDGFEDPHGVPHFQ